MDADFGFKQKADSEINGQRKKVKLQSYNANSVIESQISSQGSEIECKTLENLNFISSLVVSDNKESSVEPEYIYETLEEEMENGEDDDDYSKYGDLEFFRKKGDEELEDSISFQEDSSKEYEDELIDNDSAQSSFQDCPHEENETAVIKSTKNSSKREIQGPAQTKKTFQTRTSLQPNNQRILQTKGLKLSTKSTLQPAFAKGLDGNKITQKNNQIKRRRIHEKMPELPVPAHINQYGDCLKTRLGRHQYGLTLTDPPCQFFQGVLKGSSGQTLAAMFGDVDLLAKLGSVPLDEIIGHFVIDTTFKVIPNSTEGVNQMMTISLLLQNVVTPLWYAVTSCSSPELFKRILIEFQQHVLDWPFTSVLVNNDPAVCKAIRAVFPDIEIYGSWFHYCYSIWQEIIFHNLTKQCRAENSILLKAIKLLMVVPYLPPGPDSSPVIMVDGFVYVEHFARENDLPKEFNVVLEYVYSYWFNKVKPANFTVFGKHSFALNHIEVIQLLLLSYMKPGGNVWTLTRSFQSIAKSTHADVMRYLNGKKMNGKKNWGKKFSHPICRNMRKLLTESIDVKTFLEESTVYLGEILNIFLHPLYPTSTCEKKNLIHNEGWAIRIFSE